MKQLKIGSTRSPPFFIPRGLMSSTLGSTSKGYFFAIFSWIPTRCSSPTTPSCKRFDKSTHSFQWKESLRGRNRIKLSFFFPFSLMLGREKKKTPLLASRVFFLWWRRNLADLGWKLIFCSTCINNSVYLERSLPDKINLNVPHPKVDQLPKTPPHHVPAERARLKSP